MHQIHAVLVRIPVWILLCLLVTLNACNDPNRQQAGSDTATNTLAEEAKQPSPQSTASSSASIGSGASKPATIDPSAVNKNGRVVLGSEQPLTQAATLSKEPPPTLEVAGTPPVAPATAPADSIASSLSAHSSSEGAKPTPPAINTVATTVNTQGKASPPPVEANVATEAERNQQLATDWPQPQAVLFVSGQQHGYIEPCGCTGLENQKGGLIRRDTLLTQLKERGWQLVPLDVGNQVRRIGRQPELKFKSTVDAFRKMEYQGVALGVDDWKLSSIELVQLAGSDQLNKSPFLSANVVIWGDPSLFPSHRIIDVGGRKIGITAVLGSGYKEELKSSDIEFLDPIEKLKPIVQTLQQEGCTYKVLLAHASLEESAEIARRVPGFDLVVTAGGLGEPTFQIENIEGSQAQMVQVGTKGMYGGIIGLFDDAAQPVRYQRIAISSQFKDSQRMLAMFADYQKALADAGFEGLGANFVSHPTGRKFVGSDACGDCHTNAFKTWKDTPHFHATDSIVEPDNDRGGIPRHHDPECVSCHATGWNPQLYYPYEAGFVSPEATPLMMGSGCENCHGPGSEHVAAELGEIDVTSERLKELQQEMVLPLAKARDKCLECHDLDNSPDFHAAGAFDKYWQRVKHVGKD